MASLGKTPRTSSFASLFLLLLLASVTCTIVSSFLPTATKPAAHTYSVLHSLLPKEDRSSRSSSTNTQCYYQDPVEEWVLLVPPPLAHPSYQSLSAANCVPQKWHLEGRFGSRMHKVSDGRIAIPVMSKAVVLQQAKLCPKLQDLLSQEQVGLVLKAFNPFARDPPSIDSRIHPERAPTNTTTSITGPSSFTYVDLFSGIGGFAVALDALGGKCLMASEIDPACRRLYQHNFPKAPLEGDICQITTALPAAQGLDLLVGGFPCQPFSSLGDQPGINCPKAGGLFLEIVRLLKTSQPRAFLLENVPGLLNMTDSFQTILEELEGAGYEVHYEVCNARGLTATYRKRLFLVGFLKQPDYTPFEFPYVPDLHVRAQNVIDYTNSELTEMERRELFVTDDQLQLLQSGGYWRPAHLAWPNMICYTLISHYGKSVARGHTQLVPSNATAGNPRRFSPRECLSIMGFPRSYQLLSPQLQQHDRAFLKEQYRMAGNAVCPPLVAAIAGAVLGSALENDHWTVHGRQVAVELAQQATRRPLVEV